MSRWSEFWQHTDLGLDARAITAEGPAAPGPATSPSWSTTQMERLRRAVASAEAAALAGVAAALLLTTSVWLLSRQPGVVSSNPDL